jgi:hypothetical protein
MMTTRTGFLLTPAFLLALALVLGACQASTPSSSPSASFYPAGPCTADGQRAGTYPQLEALLPGPYQGTQPQSLDSGRTCTPAGLGTLATHGIADVRFAGETWGFGGTTGMTLAVFDAAGLEPARMLEFYQSGASTARHTDKLQASDTTVGGKPAKRLDVLGTDGSGQTVVTWPGARPGQVWVLLTADIGDAKTAAALEAFGSR